MDNGLLSHLKGAYVCLCACVCVRVTSCVELPVNVPKTSLEPQESPVIGEQRTAHVCNGRKNTHIKKKNV